MDILVWTIVHGGREAKVSESGEVSGDAELVDILHGKLNETITVYRRGTVQDREAGGGTALEMRPGDRRYVVARIRTLCAEDESFEITGCEWR